MIIIPHERSAARLNAAMQTHFPEHVAIFLDELAVMYANHEPVRGLWTDEGRKQDKGILMLSLADGFRFAQVLAYFSGVLNLEDRRAGDARPILNAIRAFGLAAADVYRQNAEAEAAAAAGAEQAA